MIKLSDYVFSFIKAKHPEPLSHSVLLRRVYRRIQGLGDFKDIIETLVEQNRIVMAASRQGIYYSVKERDKGWKSILQLSKF